MSKFKGVKTNNSVNTSKVKIRDNIFKHFKNDKNVLEVFCGDGEMYRKIWNLADNYLGIDIIKFNDERHTIHGDSKKELKKLNIDNYNIFDIDAYGSPYDELLIILDKLDKTKFNEYAFIITDGLDIDLRMGNISNSLQKLLNIKPNRIKNAHKLHDAFIKKIVEYIKDSFDNINNSKFYFTKGITGSGMRYYSLYINLQKCND